MKVYLPPHRKLVCLTAQVKLQVVDIYLNTAELDKLIADLTAARKKMCS